ncbi:MAG: UDP-2,3-diacylglucosamine diphosphatase LpxI [Deltaproteobacteria bacterium]|nr:UDP-2,3-diacylglucosamine diphosphatase LpxI [Deltaproteobacteria bacterium]
MSPESIGIIAGTSKFPLLFAQAARERGLRVVAVAHKGETFPELAELVDEITWVQLGQVGKLLKAFKKAGVSRAVMCGGVKKTRMFSDVRPDFKALALLKKIRHLADDGILRTLAAFLEEEGVQILPSHELLPELLAPAGVYTQRRPREEEEADAQVGWRVAAELGRLDVGQCVVVKGRAVVALEAIEGTDACIRRGGELAGPGAVVIKRCKPTQDLRFDLPSVGAQTIRTMAQVGCACLVVEAGKTLIFDRSELAALADQAGIAVLGWESGEVKA